MGARWRMDRDRAAWWVVGAVLFGVLVYVLHSFVGTFVFGLFIYYATRPLYRRLSRRPGPRSVWALVSILLFVVPVLVLFAYTLAVGLQEANRIIETTELAQLEALLGPYIDVSMVVQDPEQFLRNPDIQDAVRQLLNNAVSYLGFIATAALHLFVMVTIAFYLLRDDRRLADWVLGAVDDPTVERYGRVVDRDFANIFFGNILNAVITGVIGAVVYNLLDLLAPAGVGIPSPTLVGVLAGAASLVPIVGMKLVYVPVALYLGAVAASVDPRLLWFPALFAGVSFVLVDVVPDLVLRPYVSGRGLHVGMVMFAYIFGPLLFGWYGIFLGPVLLVLIVHFARVVVPDLLGGDAGSGFAGSGFEPASARNRD